MIKNIVTVTVLMVLMGMAFNAYPQATQIPQPTGGGGGGSIASTGNVLKGNGGGAAIAAVPGTDYLIPGAIGVTLQGFDADLSTLASKTILGNGANIRLSTGTPATDDCAKFDSNGNIVSAGAACGSGGGTTYSPGDNISIAGSTISVTGVQDGQAFRCMATQATTQTCTMTPTLSQYTVGQVVNWGSTTNCSGTVTLAIDGLNAGVGKKVYEADGTTSASCTSNMHYPVVYESGLDTGSGGFRKVGGGSGGGSFTAPTATTKGTIMVWNGSAWVIKAPGTDGQVLSALAADSTGLSYITPSAGASEPLDLNKMEWEDEFMTSSLTGTLPGMYFSATTGTCTASKLTTPDAAEAGVFRITTGAAGAQCPLGLSALTNPTIGNTGSGRTMTGIYLDYVIRYASAGTASVLMAVGMGDSFNTGYAVGNNSAVVLVGDFAPSGCTTGTVPSGNFFLNVSNATSRYCGDMGVALAKDTWYRIQLKSTTAGLWQARLKPYGGAWTIWFDNSSLYAPTVTTMVPHFFGSNRATANVHVFDVGRFYGRVESAR